LATFSRNETKAVKVIFQKKRKSKGVHLVAAVLIYLAYVRKGGVTMFPNAEVCQYF
jgi:hypothetical protein